MNLRQAAELANKAAAVQWVKWAHPNTRPANTSAEKTSNAIAASLNPSHCAKCLNMNGCCFAENNCPTSPLHENCHCKTERIDGVTVTAECPIEKFTGYVFSEKYIKNGKNKLFQTWGFTIADSAMLKAEYERQAYNAYISGQYQLNKLDQFGQRINIVITLNCLNGKQIKLYSGWLVYPNGLIRNATIFGGML